MVGTPCARLLGPTLCVMLLQGGCWAALTAASREDSPPPAPSTQPPPPTTPTPPQAAHVDRATGLRFPHTAGPLRYGGVRRYRRPELGYSVRYQGSQGDWADVFVYTWTQPPGGNGAQDPLVRGQFQMAESDIASVVKRGIYTHFSKRGSSLTRFAGWTFWTGAYLYRVRGAPMGSFLYVTACRSRFVKVRYTYSRQHLENRPGQTLGSLLQAMVEMMK